MREALRDAQEGFKGVLAIAAGRADFHARFDVSAAGLVRSFSAALFAIPLTAFAAGVQNLQAARAAGEIGAPEPFSALYVVVRWAAMWAYFPPLAALVTSILGRRGGFAPWVVVHNWAHLLFAIMQAPAFALVAVGAPGPGYLVLIGTNFFNAYVYVCVARAALSVSWSTAILAGTLNLAAALFVEAGLAEVM